jgi:hypothetical protein
MGASCPDGCFELPVTTGCGAERTRSNICTTRTFPTETTACGVRSEDGRSYYVDAPYEWDKSAGELIANPFASIGGFRPCTQDEVALSDCRDLSGAATVQGNVVFRITNQRSTPIWALIYGVGCRPFRIERLPDSEPLVTGYLSNCGNPCFPPEPEPAYGRMARIEPGGVQTPSWNELENHLATTIAACGESDSRCTRATTTFAEGTSLRATLVIIDDPMHPLARDCASDCPTFTPPTLDGAQALCYGDVPGVKLVEVEFSPQGSGIQTVPVVIE